MHLLISHNCFDRRCSRLVTYLQPFCLSSTMLMSGLAPWTMLTNGIDYVKLNKVVGGVDIGLKPPFTLCWAWWFFDYPHPQISIIRKTQLFPSISFLMYCTCRLIHDSVFSLWCQRGVLLPTGYVRVFPPPPKPWIVRRRFTFFSSRCSSSADQSIVLWEPRSKEPGVYGRLPCKELNLLFNSWALS